MADPVHDPVQLVSEAVRQIVDADAAVQAITGRTETNIVRYSRRAIAAPPPRLAYLATDAQIRIGTGENYDVTVILRAEADTAAVANALLRAAFEALTTTAFTGATTDAVVMDWDFVNLPEDGAPADKPPNNKALVAAEATLTIWITL